MASVGQVIFWSIIILIFIVAALIIILLCVAFAPRQASTVQTGEPFPVGNLGNDVLLDCEFDPSPANGKKAADASVTWTKDGLPGVVYLYENRAPQLQDQNPLFKDMAQVFPDAVANGNASLLLRSVITEDAGTYRCSVVAPSSQGTVTVNLRVAAFSAPSFSETNGTLTAVAQKWFPEPNVTWSNRNGSTLNATTSLSNNSMGIFRVVTTLSDPLQLDSIYICTIQNSLVRSVTQATVEGTDIFTNTLFSFSSASSAMIPGQALVLVPLLLGWLLC
ncbi:V-set domain-containing T-cell activation inhibitor 1 [Scleropages formosus]|uniref:V-set domain containing T cell activation inhibitor 1 n=1 Tax=Scleropages formosus TaxID=113540 RepID=A0A8C9TDG9_SCLFO|nr:V-set domain-containing T-cell activation inhibitor 1 [Scleropages formosus]